MKVEEPQQQWLDLALEVRLVVADVLDDRFVSSMAGACAIASYALYRVYNSRRYKTSFVSGSYGWEDHCFLLRSGYVIDITATQFGAFDLVHCVRFDRPYRVSHIDEAAVADTALWDSQNPILYWPELGEALRSAGLLKNSKLSRKGRA